MKIFLILTFLILFVECIYGDFHVSTQDMEMLVGETKLLTVYTDPITEEITATYLVNHQDIVKVTPGFHVFNANVTSNVVQLKALDAGHAEVTLKLDPPGVVNSDEAFVRILALHSYELEVSSQVIGWIYFAAWSISFYPQIYINWKRKSVIGLNFDFVVLNIIGFTLYSAFNVGLYWVPELQAIYFERYPRGQLPVLLNDVVFGLHAMFATAVTIVQCWMYERADQRVSMTARVIIAGFALFLLISIILSGVAVITWLDFLYFCSYVKLTITLIKYMPQAYMNYKRKSTVGWSIGNIFLDFTGGSLSMIQMMLNAANYNDWASLFGDPTKFGLGLFSVVFDIFFIIQHYILYRHAKDVPDDLNKL